MRLINFLIITLLLISCKANSSKDKIDGNTNSTKNKSIAKKKVDSIDVWINTSYYESIDENISICDFWRENRYQLLYYDKVKMKLYLKSNLMHYGHDSELVLPIKRYKNGYRYDSTLNDWQVEPKEFQKLSKDTLVLLDEKKTYKFVRKTFLSKLDSNIFYSSYLRNIFYELNSHLLIKYNKLDTIKSTAIFVKPDVLKKMILNGLVTGYCSDDYNYDGITIKKDTIQNYHLQFNKDELILYEDIARDRYEKVNLKNLAKQVLSIRKN